jgi:TfoX/Sxy family transcriptional regulator of competence genes
MAYDEGHAEILRNHLSSLQGVDEKKMFGGLCFMLNGNMLCGVHKGGAMFRVGKGNEQAALAVQGVSPLSFTKKRMGGMLEVDDDLLGNDQRRSTLMALALEFVGNLPAK